MECPHSDYGWCPKCVTVLRTELELSLARNTKLETNIETLERQVAALVEELNTIEETNHYSGFGSGWSSSKPGDRK